MNDHEQDQPLNREQRRAQRFGSEDHRQDDLRPESENNPSSGRSRGGTDDASDTFAGGNRDVEGLSGSGTGGATESDDRIRNREGIYLGNDPNS
jgi:hypothetical protein